MKEKQLAVIKHFGMDHQRRKLEEEVDNNQKNPTHGFSAGRIFMSLVLK